MPLHYVLTPHSVAFGHLQPFLNGLLGWGTANGCLNKTWRVHAVKMWLVQLKKREKHPWRIVFHVFQFVQRFQITQSVSYEGSDLTHEFTDVIIFNQKPATF